MESNRVLLYGWDLKGFPKPVLKALKLISKINDGKIPKYLIHVGVAVFRRFYHFNQKGLQIAFEIPNKKVNLLPPETSFDTRKSHAEFEDWFNSEENRNKFSSARYHPVHNNCIDFALSACEFLGVPMIDGFHTDLNNWIKDHEHVKRLFKSEKFLAFFGISIGVSRRTFVDSTDAVDEDEDDDDEIDEDKLIGWEKL
ncbi:uncharacterized protein LOC110847460 isoform X2 [Folsomia candida]|uniref:uncharacterized protein LOC110847460 isoform X2 n=1 Tax=Folsomia candida TaxID=158441 RepID=UPI000B8EFB58|nr:uncharacterized protein LOC110847460 isoform X2 [Folsomia candida]